MKRLHVGPMLEGKQLTDAGGGTGDVINPATGETVATQTCCDPATVERIVQSSHNAFRSTAWQAMAAPIPGHVRSRTVRRVQGTVEA